jgi:large subunit ribosomal protein L10
MPTAQKAAIIEDLTDRVTRSKLAVMVTYSGMNVAQLTDVRRQLRKQNVELKVVKNTLLREATRRAHLEGLDHLFTQANAMVFVYDNEQAATRAINDVVRASRGVVTIKSGIMRGRVMEPEAVARVADLPAREELLARAVGAMAAPLSSLLGTLNAPAQQLAMVLAALQAKKAEEAAAS